MSTRITDKKKGRERTYDYRKILIQCPDCGTLFNFTEEGECFCKKCNKFFTDDEVRARCGL